MSVNKVIIVGRLGTDPEVRYTSNGTAVANFNVATNEFWTGKDGQKQERTEWHRMVVWGKQAELAKQYLSKGREAYFEGTLQTRNWEDQQGNKRYTTEIKVQNMRFLGGSASDSPNYSSNGNDRSQSDYGSQAPSYESSSQPMKEPSFTDDDIPF